jgi:CRP-like cAMP-binding protein
MPLAFHAGSLDPGLPEQEARWDSSCYWAEEVGMDVAKLDGLRLFDGLSRQQLESIAQHAQEVDVPEGKALAHDGALAWDFYVIREGTADVRHGPTTLGTLGPGDFFGEIGVMASDRRRTASVVATSPMRAIKLTTHQVRTISDEMPEFADRLRAAIAEREQHLL